MEYCLGVGLVGGVMSFMIRVAEAKDASLAEAMVARVERSRRCVRQWVMLVSETEVRARLQYINRHGGT